MTGSGTATRSGGSIRGDRPFAERGKNVYHEAREEISITGQGTREPAEVPVRIVTLPAAKGTWGGERKKPRRAYTGGV